MQKGKFGFSLWLYPFIAMWLVLIGPAIGPLLILGFVIFAERDEWAIKQCAHAVMFSIYWGVYNYIMDILIGSLGSIPFIGGVAALPLTIIDIIVWIVLVILVLILGLGRLKNGLDIGLPGKGIVNRAYGFVQTYVHNYQSQQQYAQPQQQYAQQNTAPPPQQQYAQQSTTPPPQQQYAQQSTAPPPQQQYAQQSTAPPPQQQYAQQNMAPPPQQQYAQQNTAPPPQQPPITDDYGPSPDAPPSPPPQNDGQAQTAPASGGLQPPPPPPDF